MKKLFIILFLFLMISSCKKEIEVPESSLQQVFGTWQWYLSSGSVQMLSPESEGYSKYIEITDKGIYKEYKNHVRRKKLKYSFDVNKSMVHHLPYRINFKDELVNFSFPIFPLVIEMVSLDTLFLHEDVFDGATHCYVRKK